MTKFEPEVKRRAHHGFRRYHHVLSADEKATGLATYGESLVDQFEPTRKRDPVSGRAGYAVSLGAFSVGDQQFTRDLEATFHRSNLQLSLCRQVCLWLSFRPRADSSLPSRWPHCTDQALRNLGHEFPASTGRTTASGDLEAAIPSPGKG
jgi:hypothetical protein